MPQSLPIWLEDNCPDHDDQYDLVGTVLKLAEAGRILSAIIAQGENGSAHQASVAVNADGDEQKPLDVIANDLIVGLLHNSDVAWLASEELVDAVPVNGRGRLAVAIDPLDGSSNIDTNLSLGTIFCIYKEDGLGPGSVLQTGRKQLAAGYIIYGPQTSLVLTVGQGTSLFVLDRARRQYFLNENNVLIPEETREFAINASNFRHWEEPVKDYVEDCLDGEDGPRGENFNMRWLASLVAECQRILSRGGVFLYPADRRQGYEKGRLRLVYEANAVALLVEQAGGRATTGETPILDLKPASIHERVPLVFGSATEVTRFEDNYVTAGTQRRKAPLFAHRGLFAQ